MKLTVTLSANAGVALQIGGKRLWVDALHEEKQPGFSTLSPQLQAQMLQSEAFSRPDYILWTHEHPDHYSAKLTAAAKNIWPGAVIVPPGSPQIRDGDLTVDYLPLPHEGERYADVPHYGILVCCAGKRILFTGDCAVASEALLDALAGKRPDLIFLDFPWIALPKGRKFLQSHLPQARLVVDHLPFEWEDVNRYRSVTHRAAALVENAVVLSEPLQSVTIDV